MIFIENVKAIRFLLILLLFTCFGCSKFVTVDTPITSTSSQNVYETDATAAAVLTSIYAQLSVEGMTSPNIRSISLFAGLSADELSLYPNLTTTSNPAAPCYKNAQTPQFNGNIWGDIYFFVYQANAAVEGIEASNSLSSNVKNQLLGEAKFLRAFFYFYLTNIYGDAPLILSTDYTKTAIVPRNPKAEIYTQIVSDLLDAQKTMNDDYVDATATTVTPERVRPNKWVATALLARVYLFLNDYVDAETQATLVINNSAKYTLSSINDVFLKNSSETIWQLQPVNSGYNTNEASFFVLPASGPNTYANFAYLSSNILNAFEPNDHRRINWVDSVTANGITYYFPYKYKINIPDIDITTPAAMTEYSTIIRLAEMFLIRAEAESNGAGNGIGGAVSDINTIRDRAGLLPYAGSTDKDSLVATILHERQVELFSEWGHRWFDLKRTGIIDAVMGGPNGTCAAKGGTWMGYDQLYPIDASQLQVNPLLIQNPGY